MRGDPVGGPLHDPRNRNPVQPFNGAQTPGFLRAHYGAGAPSEPRCDIQRLKLTSQSL